MSPVICAKRSAVAEPTPGMHLAWGGSCDFAQDDGQRGRRRATASRASFCAPAPRLSSCAARPKSCHSARSEAQSQNPRPGCTLPGVDPATSRRMTGKGDGADRQRAGRRSARPPPRLSSCAARPNSCHSARSEAQSQNPRPGCTLPGVDPATSRRMTGKGVGAERQRAGVVLRARPSCHFRAPQQLSFCAERSAVAESTPAEACPDAWILRLRAGRHAISPVIQRGANTVQSAPATDREQRLDDNRGLTPRKPP